MTAVATRADALEFFQRAAISLSRVEAAGIRVDTDYLDRTISETDAKVKTATAALKNDRIFGRWRRRFGEKTNLGSRTQLGKILFEDLGYESATKTRTGREKTDEDALEKIDLPFVRDWLQCEKLKKLNSTYLKGLRREIVGGYVHAIYNLNLVETYRSSCDTPNIQNVPIRLPELAAIIRRAFRPRRGRVFVEIDLKGAEVCAGACYHHDPAMIAYIRDPRTDMHRDVAAQMFAMRESRVPKPLRQLVKGAYVFASFYGSWYKNTAPALWNGVQEMEYRDGVSVLDHLESKTGITELGECAPPVAGEYTEPPAGTFEHRVWKIERDFWGRRFRGYADWKKSWYADYLRRGYFDTLTGFRYSGVYSRKEASNYPIQGTAFHFLLWALCELDDWLRANRMKSLIIGEIHDSMILDCTEDELEAVVARAEKIITKYLPRHWPWIIVPLTAEIEASRTNWHEKAPLAI